MNIRYLLLLLIGAFPQLAIAQTTNEIIPSGDQITASTTISNPDVMRGYGKISTTMQAVSGGWGFWKKNYLLWRFEATSPENAATVAGKFLADLTLSPGVTRGTLDLSGKKFPLITVPAGASYTGFARGNIGYVISSGDSASLNTFLSSMPAAVGDVVTDLNYPEFLDRFDRYGWGSYGFKPQWDDRAPKGTSPVDPLADLDFCAKYNFRFELWPQPGELKDCFSLDEWNARDWEMTEAARRGIPMSCRLYGDLPHEKQFTDAFEQPAFFLQGGWHGPDLAQKTYPHQSWFDPNARLYMARQVQQLMKPLQDRPDIGSWMSPYGELFHDPWYNQHADYGPAATASWRDTLQNKYHFALAQVSAMYERSDRPFTSWDEVEIPEAATFAGLPQMVQDLDHDWYTRPETTPDEGLQGRWWNADVRQAPWEKMNLPGTVQWQKYFTKTEMVWCVRDFNVASDALNTGKPLYLYNFVKIYGDPHVLVPIYINGQKVGETGLWGALDVSKFLKPGTNRLALKTEYFSGRVFLSTEEPSVYPYLGPDRNKLWIVWHDWLSDGKHDAWAIVLSAMRESDPNRPIKFMDPSGMGADRWLDLASRFGGWGHFTGEGTFTFLWFKRYGYLYGLPSTSEDAGPPENVPQMFDTYQRCFLEGLNGHDHVFTVQDITGRPDVKAWYENHIAVLKQMGRWDIAGPQVVIYRSTNSATALSMPPTPTLGDKTREIQSIWNWDFGRGTFPSIGQSTLYVDDGGLADQKINDYKILVDGGNEIMPEASLKYLEDWVRHGGTYIVLPFTGRSVPSAPDSWPIKVLTGCDIKALRTPGKGTVTIAQDQPLFKELAGKTFSDAGSSVDFQSFEHNFLSVELAPGADCQVVASYEDGAPAIVVHQLGAGRVIVLGSAFFRQSRDIKGIWPAGDNETSFFRDLLTNLGQPSVNYTSDRDVYAQRYQTNNGLDDVVVLDNFSDGDRTVDVHVTLGCAPQKVYRAAMNTVQEVPFTANGGSVTLAGVQIPKNEVQIYYFRTHDTNDAANHWLAYQQKIWRSSNPMKIDFTPISQGRWVDPVIDLKHDWKWNQDTTADDSWTRADFDDKAWKTWGLDVYSAVGADAAKPIQARKTFTLSPDWLKAGELNNLTVGAWSTPFTVCGSDWKIWLNGQLLQYPDPKNPDFFNPEVSPQLHAGENTLAMEIGPAKKGNYIGVQGTVYLTHSKPPVKTVSLTGTWTGSLEGKPITLQFPGKGKCVEPTRSFDIPADWKDKYVVTYYIKASRHQTLGVIVNDSAVRRHHHIFGDEGEVDITPWLHFGQTNTFSPLEGIPVGPVLIGNLSDWDVSQIELRLYPRDEYR